MAKVYEAFHRENRSPIALYRVLAHAPELLRAYSGLARALRYEAETSRGLRELAILRTAQLVESEYEWAHHVPMAEAAGVREDKIRSLRYWQESEAFDAVERTVLKGVDEIDAQAMSDESFEALVEALGDSGAVEIVLLVSFYQAIARMIQAFGLEVESDYQRYLDTW